ncbi:hydrolase [Anaeromicropila herbilytica]|uniref:Hydrolase n=1 Tax=Anaeromicropila herbilytica TaxID=2785025 RepID=A0A7R7IEG0_9FIRM|nr:hydrolase [Anaeromicropila herbilytica]BCN31956.1 hydrolase [Anaeromicropila herbilytica]
MRIQLQDTLALVIDYQEKLIPVMNNKETLIHNTKILLEGLNILQVPMIITEQYPKGLGNTIPVIVDSIPQTPILEKLSFSAKDENSILHQIKSSNKKNIIICGIEAHICVLQTVIDLLEMNYQVILVADCISSRKESDQEYAITRAIKEGAIITTYEAILFELTRKAGSETFKQISKLIK